jgi:hypothetical protein
MAVQDGFVMSNSDPGSTGSGEMTARTAIFYAEHPLALLRDFETEHDQAAALKRVEQALARAPEVDPLAFAAFRLRQDARRRTAVGVGQGAARLLAWRRSGAAIPDLPERPV